MRTIVPSPKQQLRRERADQASDHAIRTLDIRVTRALGSIRALSFHEEQMLAADGDVLLPADPDERADEIDRLARGE